MQEQECEVKNIVFVDLQKPKPVVWERVKKEERFNFVNSSKLEHVVVGRQLVEESKIQSDMW